MKFRLKMAFCLLCALAGTAHAQSLGFFDLPVLQPNLQPGQAYVPNDVDGNGISDVLWFNPVTHQFGYWLVSVDKDGYFRRGKSRTIDVTPGYMVGALGDFNGDKRVDLVWTSDHSDLYLWSSAGSGFRSSLIGTYPPGWKLLGAGDVDGDGQPDLLWQNDTTHEFGYWLMHGSKRVGTKTFPLNAGYRLVAIGYFGTMRRISLVWQGQAGDLYDWDSRSGNFRSYYIGSPARASGTYHLDAAIIPGAAAPHNTMMWFITLDANGTRLEQYGWERELDAQGNQTSSFFGSGVNGGWGTSVTHHSGQLYYHAFGNFPSYTIAIMTDRSGTSGYPQTISIDGINNQSGGGFGWAPFYAGFPSDWYVIGEPWYRTDQIYYGPSGP
jgi:hypothetical protein